MAYHEKTQEYQFIPNDHFSLLYMQKGFVEKHEEKPISTVISSKPSEPFVPGKKLFTSVKEKSFLSKQQHLQCLAALKCLRSGKDPTKFTEVEKSNIAVYKVTVQLKIDF